MLILFWGGPAAPAVAETEQLHRIRARFASTHDMAGRFFGSYSIRARFTSQSETKGRFK